MSLSYALREMVKRILYRSPALGWLTRPNYAFNLSPEQLALLVTTIEATRHLGGAIVEVGVARGMTTVFLNTHMRNTQDARSYICIDTFAGFIPEHISHERTERGKNDQELHGFSYGDFATFKRHMRECGFHGLRLLKKDCSLLTVDDLGQVSLALLDVDLYLPTKAAIGVLFDALVPGGVMMVDDVKQGTAYDGAAAAYFEFCRERGISPDVRAEKAGMLIKPS